MFTRIKKLSIVLLLVAACLAMPVTVMASEKQLQGTSRLHRGHTSGITVFWLKGADFWQDPARKRTHAQRTAFNFHFIRRDKIA